MSTKNYQTAKSKAGTKAHLLLEIDLIGTGTTYDSSKTIYLSDNYITVDGVKYEGIVQSWGGMDVTIFNEGISAISDYSIVLQNKRLNFMEGDVRFSDIFDDYYFAGSVCRVYQWFEELSSKDDAELIFNGFTKQPSFDLSEIRFDVLEENNIDQNIPLDIVALNNFTDAPEESIDKPLPIVYGNDWEWTNTISNKAVVSPCIETDKNLKTFYIANHKVEAGAVATKMLIYLPDAKRYGFINAGNVVYTNDSDGARFTLEDDISYDCYMAPTVKGSLMDASYTDYSNAVDQDASTSLGLTQNTEFYTKFDSFPNQGVITGAIQLKCNIANLVGTPTLNYWNPNFNNFAGGYGTGQNLAGSTTLDIKNDKNSHGTEAAQADQTFAWTLKELADLEYGITLGAGESLDLQAIYLVINIVSLVYTRPVMEPTRRPRP